MLVINGRFIDKSFDVGNTMLFKPINNSLLMSKGTPSITPLAPGKLIIEDFIALEVSVLESDKY